MVVVSSARLVVLVSLTVLSVCASGCDSEVPAQPCNSSLDCPDVEDCSDGFCVAANTLRPTVDAGRSPDVTPPQDGGTRDGGATDAGTRDGGIRDGGLNDGGPGDGGPGDGGPGDGGPPVPPGTFAPQWRTRVQMTLANPDGLSGSGLVLPVSTALHPALADPTLRLSTLDGEALKYERTSEMVWVHLPTIDGEIGLYAYFDGPTTTVAPAPASVWPDAIGVWHFDDDTRDSSVNELHGDENGVRDAEGAVGHARKIIPDIAGNGGITLPPQRDIVGGHNVVSAVTWVRVDEAQLEDRLLSFSNRFDTTTSNMLLFRNPMGAWRFRVVGGLSALLQTYDTDPLLTAPAGDWVHLVAIANFGTQRVDIYQNGISILSTAMRPETTTPRLIATHARREKSFNLALGGEDDGTEALAGALDEVRLFRRNFTAEEVALLFAHEQSGGTLATFDDVESWFGAAVGQSPAPTDDVMQLRANGIAIIDVLANDGAAFAQGRVLDVTPQSPNALVSARVRNDGRIEVRNLDASTETMVLDVRVSDGVRPPHTSTLTVERSANSGPKCRHLTAKIRPGDIVEFSAGELGTAAISAAAASRGTVSTDAASLLYVANANEDAAVVDVLFTLSDGEFACDGVVTLDFNTRLSVGVPSGRVAVDPLIPRRFEFPNADAHAEAALEVEFDPVFEGPRVDIDVSAENHFTVLTSSTATEWQRFHLVDANGLTSRSGVVEFSNAGSVAANFSDRRQIEFDATGASARVDDISVLVEAGVASTNVAFFAAGSQTPLAFAPEGQTVVGQRRFRVRVPEIFAGADGGYIWAYANGQSAPPPDPAVWNADVGGAWALSQSYADQSGNGNDAAGAFVHTPNGVDFSGTGPLGAAVELPTLDATPLHPPFTIEVVFVPQAPWGAGTRSQMLISRFLGGEAGNYHLGWASIADYVVPNHPEFAASAFVAKIDSAEIIATGAAYVLSDASPVDTEVQVMAHVVKEGGPGTLYVNGDGTAATPFSVGVVDYSIDYVAPWVIGPGQIDAANIAEGVLGTEASIRSVRVWGRAISRDRAWLSARNERGELCRYGMPETIP